MTQSLVWNTLTYCACIVPPGSRHLPLVFGSLDLLLQLRWQLFQFDKSHAHAVAPEEHGAVLCITQVIELIRAQQVFFFDRLIETWDLGLDKAPRNPVGVIGGAPLSGLLQQFSHALVSLFVVGSFRSAPTSWGHSRIKHELDNGA